MQAAAAIVESSLQLRGQHVTLRPIRATDAAIEQDFVRNLSQHSRQMRFQDALTELSPAELQRLTDIDHHCMVALIAVVEEQGREREIGVARYALDTHTDTHGEFAIVVADAWQGSGLATALMHALLTQARSRGMAHIYGDILSYNMRMRRFVEKLGFRIESHPDEHHLVRAVLAL